MRYLVNVASTDCARVGVDAPSKEEAEDMVFRMFMDGLIRWQDNFVEFEVKEEEENGTEKFLD